MIEIPVRKAGRRPFVNMPTPELEAWRKDLGHTPWQGVWPTQRALLESYDRAVKRRRPPQAFTLIDSRGRVLRVYEERK